MQVVDTAGQLHTAIALEGEVGWQPLIVARVVIDFTIPPTTTLVIIGWWLFTPGSGCITTVCVLISSEDINMHTVEQVSVSLPEGSRWTCLFILHDSAGNHGAVLLRKDKSQSSRNFETVNDRNDRVAHAKSCDPVDYMTVGEMQIRSGTCCMTWRPRRIYIRSGAAGKLGLSACQATAQAT